MSGIVKCFSIIVALLVSFPFPIFSQRAIPDTDLTLPILIHSPGGLYASGFYFQDTSFVNLVTARHVLFRDSTSVLNSATLSLISDPADPAEHGKNILELHIDSLLGAGLISDHPNHDVALIRIGITINSRSKGLGLRFLRSVSTKQKTRSGILTIHERDTVPYDSVLISNELYIMGYPRAIGVRDFPQVDYSSPLLRRGIIAGKNDQRRVLILDCPIHGGNSGGPVIQVTHQQSGLVTCDVVGVLTEYVPWLNPTLGAKDTTISNSSYSVAEPIDSILELIRDSH